MTSSLWHRASLVVLVAALTTACADEDLDDGRAAGSRSITVSGIGANAPSPTGASVSPASPPAKTAAPPLFYRVRARPGDTVASVAQRFGIRPEYVIWNNEGVLRDGELSEGTTLDIPSANGILHRPLPGETLLQVAARYGVESQAILDHPANAALGPTSPLPPTILVPNGRIP